MPEIYVERLGARRWPWLAAGVLLCALAVPGPAFPAAAQSGGPSRVAAARVSAAKPPTRLWYRLDIRYVGVEHARSTVGAATTASVYRVGVQLRPQTAVLLRRGPGRTFSILANRPLVGRVTRWSWDWETTVPHCSVMSIHWSAWKLGRAETTLVATPLARGDASGGALGRDAVEVGIAPGPLGYVAKRVHVPSWTCNGTALEQDRIRYVPYPNHGEVTRWHSDDGNRWFGLLQDWTQDESFSNRWVRAPTARESLRIRGVAFGTRAFVRVATVESSRTVTHPTTGDTATRKVDETWTLTFDRCPAPTPC